jgi:hypothetical protein
MPSTTPIAPSGSDHPISTEYRKGCRVAGLGNGFVDVFYTDGQLLRRFAPRGMEINGFDSNA